MSKRGRARLTLTKLTSSRAGCSRSCAYPVAFDVAGNSSGREAPRHRQCDAAWNGCRHDPVVASAVTWEPQDPAEAGAAGDTRRWTQRARLLACEHSHVVTLRTRHPSRQSLRGATRTLPDILVQYTRESGRPCFARSGSGSGGVRPQFWAAETAATDRGGDLRRNRPVSLSTERLIGDPNSKPDAAEAFERRCRTEGRCPLRS